jgi:hypothetical protein
MSTTSACSTTEVYCCLDNGDGRPAAEGGQYSRALELALDWNSMTASKVWEYRHQVVG